MALDKPQSCQFYSNGHVNKLLKSRKEFGNQIIDYSVCQITINQFDFEGFLVKQGTSCLGLLCCL